ncbi:hypothetical protein SFC65_20125 [Priestia filamentosa]|uniref:hypothetical protein n=1 Tax=Priestia filamentosa TaxID=1402861 RepID=UPI003981E818
MGIDTGAYKNYEIKNENEIIFSGYFDDEEGVNLKYPNAEFYELATTLRRLTNSKIDLTHYLIWDDLDYEEMDYTRIIHRVRCFKFEDAISEGEKEQSNILRKTTQK